MKQKLRQIVGRVLIVALMMSMVMVPTKKAEAATYKYGTFAVTGITNSSVTIDYRNVYYDFIKDGASVLGYKITAENLTTGSGEILVAQPAANQVYGTINGLTAGHTYSIVVRTTYKFQYTDAGESYDYVQLVIPADGIGMGVDVVTDQSIITPATPTPVPSINTPVVPNTPVTPVAPSISGVKMVGDNVAAAVSPVSCNGYEYGIFNKKTGKLVKSQTTSSTSSVFYGVSRKNIYIMKARAYKYDTSGNKIYSAWGKGKYFVPQPKIKNKASKLKKNSIILKWNKVTGAKKYTIYMRKRYAKKWYKVKTVSGKKASYTIKKFRGKKVNAYRQNYEVKVKATAKIGGKTYNSTSDDYIYTYTYTRYR